MCRRVVEPGDAFCGPGSCSPGPTAAMPTTVIPTSEPDRRPDPAGSATVRPSETCDVHEIHAGPVERARARAVSESTASALAETFRVLGDPTRVRILDAISEGELCVCDIAELVGQSDSAVSHQLRLLRSMRLVRARRSGRQVFYALDDHHIIDLVAQGVKHVMEG
jgi:DNA-binding transcriptional ArsR family regulator